MVRFKVYPNADEVVGVVIYIPVWFDLKLSAFSRTL